MLELKLERGRKKGQQVGSQQEGGQREREIEKERINARSFIQSPRFMQQTLNI